MKPEIRKMLEVLEAQGNTFAVENNTADDILLSQMAEMNLVHLLLHSSTTSGYVISAQGVRELYQWKSAERWNTEDAALMERFVALFDRALQEAASAGTVRLRDQKPLVAVDRFVEELIQQRSLLKTDLDNARKQIASITGQ